MSGTTAGIIRDIRAELKTVQKELRVLLAREEELAGALESFVPSERVVRVAAPVVERKPRNVRLNEALRIIEAEPGLNTTQLAQKLKVSPQQAGQLRKRLEKDNLVLLDGRQIKPVKRKRNAP